MKVKLIAHWFFILFHPSFWIINKPYDEWWDQRFNELMDKYSFEEIGRYHATLGDEKLWIANYPYGCFEHCKYKFPFDIRDVRPSRWTIYKARKKLEHDYYLSLKQKELPDGESPN